MNEYRPIHSIQCVTGGAGDWVMWRAHTEVLHCVFDQIPKLQNCFSTPNKNPEGEGASDRGTPAAKYLYWSIFKKSRHLGFVAFIDIWCLPPGDLDSDGGGSVEPELVYDDGEEEEVHQHQEQDWKVEKYS